MAPLTGLPPSAGQSALLSAPVAATMPSPQGNTTDANVFYNITTNTDPHSGYYLFWQIFYAFDLYYIPVIILVGLIGNFLSCSVFLNTHLKLRSSSYYLAALATADLGFLTTIAFVWLNSYTNLQVYNKNGWCQCLIYASNVCSFLSVWLIVAFTHERFIAVQYPLRRPRICTIRRAKIVITCLTGIGLISQVYVFRAAGLQGGTCELMEEYHEVMFVITIVDSVVTLIVPVALIIVMNAMITRNLLRFSKRFKNPLPTSESRHSHLNRLLSASFKRGSRGSKSPSQISTSELPMTRRGNENSRSIHLGSSRNNLVSMRTQQKNTKMLLLISTVFIILNLPSYVIRFYKFLLVTFLHEKPSELAVLIQNASMLLFYTNFSINFLLYSMCGITFRRCVRQLIRDRFVALQCHVVHVYYYFFNRGSAEGD